MTRKKVGAGVYTPAPTFFRGFIFLRKKVTLPTQKAAEQLTGLQAGGISPLALINKGFQVLLDQSARAFPEIHISGGQRGLNIRLWSTVV